jgi:Flp pilus assembly protein TadG
MRRASAIVDGVRRRRVAGLWRDERGQAFIMVALMLTMLLGFIGIVIDVGWYEVNLVRVQRAADAAALAGVVYLPGNLPGGVTAAKNESAKNGFTDGAPGVFVTATQDSGNPKIMLTSVTAPVQTYFARLFGVNSFTASRRARAEFILPVPMGSPENYYGINVLCKNSDTPPACPQVPDAAVAGNLAPLGFFGGVEFKGGDRQNGDAYSPYYNSLSGVGGLNVATSTNGNTGFDANGYNYIAEFPAATADGKVWLYDPIFCATGGQSSTGRRLGVGDFWFGNGGTPLTTVYSLWDMNGTPYNITDDTLLATRTWASNGVDKSAGYQGNGSYGGGAGTGSGPDCANDPAHNKWVLLASGLGEGQYRLQVVTSSGSFSENGVNGFGIEVSSSAGALPHIYGQSRMEAFIVINNTSVFYLAQVEAAHAGKVLEISLFDPGDISSTTFKIRIPSASAPGYTYATFTYTATGSSCGAPTSGGPTTTLTTSSSSCKYYDNQWVTISATIPTTYTAPIAPGDPPGAGGGWWKIEYGTLGTGQDITTWQVNIRGNPVHLVIP